MTPTTRALAPIDRKVIDKPYKYTGDIRVYIQWSQKLKDHLCIYDERWRGFLDAIEEEGSKPIDDAKALEIGLKIGISEHLGHTYLSNFLDKAPLLAVTAAKAKGVMEAYRRIADAGRSRRPEHVHTSKGRGQAVRQQVRVIR